MKLFALLASIATALVVGACTTATGPVSLKPGTDPAWGDEMAAHTRRSQTYNMLDLMADLDATLVTPRLRAAFVSERSQFHGRNANDFEMELLSMGARPDEGMDAPVLTHASSEEQVVVVVTFYVADQRYSDLAASYSIWDTELVRGKARVKPIKVETLRYDPSTASVLPHADRFDKIYLMRFPLVDAPTGIAMLSPGGDPLRLEVHSALGEVNAEWTLTE